MFKPCFLTNREDCLEKDEIFNFLQNKPLQFMYTDYYVNKDETKDYDNILKTSIKDNTFFYITN